jgi:hypothetical protein
MKRREGKATRRGFDLPATIAYNESLQTYQCVVRRFFVARRIVFESGCDKPTPLRYNKCRWVLDEVCLKNTLPRRFRQQVPPLSTRVFFRACTRGLPTCTDCTSKQERSLPCAIPRTNRSAFLFRTRRRGRNSLLQGGCADKQGATGTTYQSFPARPYPREEMLEWLGN